jgi:hypothetical protein
MENMKNCQNCGNCGRFVDHKNGVFLGDGLCHLNPKKPKPVRRWFTKCKYWITHKED